MSRSVTYKGKSLPKGIFYDEKAKSFGYRLKIKGTDGKTHDVSKIGYRLQSEAKEAREQAKRELQDRKKDTQDVESKTFNEVFNYFLDNLAQSREVSTVKKHKSVYKNHIEQVYGECLLDRVTVGELQEFLYSKRDKYARAYVESILKTIYLLYGVAYDYKWVQAEHYKQGFENKSTKLRVPKYDYVEEDDDLVIFTKEEIDKIDEVLKGTHLYCAFMLGKYLGLRVGESCGLLWSDIDFKNKRVSITKQLQEEEGELVLKKPKSKAGRRILPLPDVLANYLALYKEEQDARKRELKRGYKDIERVYDKINNKELIGTDFIQRKENGQLITVTAFKYWNNKIKEKTGIHFKYHYLRHTVASRLAAQGVTEVALKEFMGHSSIKVTEKYYTRADEDSKAHLVRVLNSVT